MMKKMWKKNTKAVSPVIATILMVAITVVLAAVLYVMVMGFGGDSSGQAPTASLTNSGNRLVLSISEAEPIDGDMVISISINDTVFNTLGTPTNGQYTLKNTTGAPKEFNVVFVDAGLDGKISTGDYFTNAYSPVSVKILWSSGGTTQVIAEGTI